MRHKPTFQLLIIRQGDLPHLIGQIMIAGVLPILRTWDLDARHQCPHLRGERRGDERIQRLSCGNKVGHSTGVHPCQPIEGKHTEQKDAQD